MRRNNVSDGSIDVDHDCLVIHVVQVEAHVKKRARLSPSG